MTPATHKPKVRVGQVAARIAGEIPLREALEKLNDGGPAATPGTVRYAGSTTQSSSERSSVTGSA